MAFLLTDRKKVKICKIPDFDESLIENIRKVKEIKIPNDEDQTPPDQAGFGEQGYPIDEKYFDYMFYFQADLRKSIKSKYPIARVTIKRNLNQESYSLFDKVESNAKMEFLLSSFYGQGKDSQASIIREDHNFLSRTYVNLIHEIDSFKLRKADKLTDRVLFGTKTKTVFVSPEEFKKDSKNIQIAQKSVSIFDINLVDSNDFSKLSYEEIITLGHDPSESSISVNQESPADKRLEGCFVTPKYLTGNIVLDSLKMSTMKNYISKFNNKNDISTDIKNQEDGDKIGVNKSVVDRVRLFSNRFSIKESDMGNQNQFWVVIDLLNKNGMIGQTIRKRINHRQNVEDYYTPSSLINCKISNSFSSPGEEIKISLSKTDRNISSCRLFWRYLKEGSQNDLIPFSAGEEIVFDKNIDSLTRIRKKYISKKSGNAVIARAVPISSQGVQYGNFTSSIIKTGPFIPNRSSLCTYPLQYGIQVKLHNASPDTIGVIFERRDITKKEKRFKAINKHVLEKNNPTAPVPQKYTALLGSLPLKTYDFVDTNVVHGRTYEYRAKLELKYGVSRTTFPTRFQKFNRISKLIDVSITPPTVQLDQSYNSQSLSLYNQRGASISFSVNFKMASTDSTKILESLNVAGLSGMYSSEVQEIKSSLDNLIFFEVTRFNVLTGETSYLGSFPQGVQIFDDGIRTSALKPMIGQRYIYRAEANLVSPGEAISTIQSLSGNENNSLVENVSDLDNPQTVLQMRKRAQASAVTENNEIVARANYVALKAEKYYSSTSLKNGTIPDASRNNRIVLSRYPTGDFYDVEISTTKNYAISGKSITFATKDTGPIIRFKVEGDSRTLIDYFVIVGRKQGRKTVIGNCHCLMSGDIAYIDLLNKSFVGTIQYSIIPVFYTGELGKEVIIGKIDIPDRQKSFRRSN